MSSKDERGRNVVAFLLPKEMEMAIETVAAQEMCSRSQVIRQAVLKDLRERGFLANNAAVA